MSFFPYSLLFSSTLILGSLMSLSSNTWIVLWAGLELNLLSFVPLLTSSKTNQEKEAAMKYFLSQALGSGLLLVGALNFNSSLQSILPQHLSSILIFSGLLIKLGLPPCHFWFPSVMSSISWLMCAILSTWQKVVPLFIIIYFFFSSLSYPSILLILTASTISALGGISQTQIKPLLAYSSIGHMSWMLAGSIMSFSVSLSYFLIYCLISLFIMSLLHFSSINSIINLASHKVMIAVAPFLFLSILSLGGVPPFLGFFPKWAVIQSLTEINLIVIFILILGSMINLYYYLNLIFIMFLNPVKFMIFSPHNLSCSISPSLFISSIFLFTLFPTIMLIT